ncbi:MAG: Phenylacetic acid catabolic protein [Sphingobium sp.]
MEEILDQVGIETPKLPMQVIGGRVGKHSEHLSRLLAEMQVLPRAHPEAVW